MNIFLKLHRFFFFLLPFTLIFNSAFSLFARGSSLPISIESFEGFIENKGQVIDQNKILNPNVKYLLALNGMNVQLRENGFSYEIRKSKHSSSTNNLPSKNQKLNLLDNPDIDVQRIDIQFENINTGLKIEAVEQLGGHFNFYTSGTSSEGITNVHHFKKIIYKNVWNAIDIEFVVENNSKGVKSVKYNFIVGAGAESSDIHLRILGAQSSITTEGAILMKTRLGEINEQIPESYIIAKNKKNKTDVRFISIGENLFGVNTKTQSKGILVIDPIPSVSWSTYYGGTSGDYSYAVCADKLDNILLGGHTSSGNNIATTGAHQIVLSTASDACVAKFDSAGVRLWATYYGGNGGDLSYGINIDDSNNVLLCGMTNSSTNMSTFGALQTTYGGSTDGFLAKFNSSGILHWATYYGGSGYDYFYGLNCDSIGNVFLGGVTGSGTGISTVGAHQSTLAGSYDAFFVKFNANGSLQWGTYYGGTGQDECYGFYADKQGNSYATGKTSSTNNMASSGAYQSTNAGSYDAFVVKFNTSGVRQWGTYFGGSDHEDGYGICSDPSGNVIITGGTLSLSNIATAGSHQTSFGGGTNDGFIAKFNSSGALQWSTYYGGSSYDVLGGIVSSANGDIWLIGLTTSTNGIATVDALQLTFAGGPYDSFIVRMNTAGVNQWSTYIGYTFDDEGLAINRDKTGNIIASGHTNSPTGMATPGSHQSSHSGGMDMFLAKLDIGCAGLNTSLGPDTVICKNNTLILDAGAGFASYLWSTGSTNQTINVSDSGTISVTVMSALGCIVKDTIDVNVTECLYITSPLDNENGKVFLFPNPASNYVLVKMNASDLQDKTKLSIFDILGRIVLETIPVSTESRMNISNLCPGIYYWKALSQNQSIVGSGTLVLER